MPRCYKATSEIALICGVDTPAVLKAAAALEIAPKKGAKGAKLWPCPEVPRALFAGPERKGLEFERERLTKAQADKTELEAEVLRGNLIPVEEVVAEVSRKAAVMRARLLSIPTRVAAVAATMSEAEIQALLADNIGEALHEMARESLGGAGTTAKAHREPVGRPESATKPRGKRRARKVDN